MSTKQSSKSRQAPRGTETNNTTLRNPNDNREQIVQVNCIKPLLEREVNVECTNWNPPLFHHHGPMEKSEASEGMATVHPAGSSGWISNCQQFKPVMLFDLWSTTI